MPSSTQFPNEADPETLERVLAVLSRKQPPVTLAAVIP